MSADVTLQVAVKVWSRGEESQADGHQLPASLQTVVAEILCSLTTQLNVKLVTQALVTPSAHHHLPKTESWSDNSLSPLVLNTMRTDHMITAAMKMDRVQHGVFQQTTTAQNRFAVEHFSPACT